MSVLGRSVRPLTLRVNS